MSQPPEIDKAQHYGRYEAGEERRRKKQDQRDDLALRVAAKGLDMALDDDDTEMNVSVDKSRRGMGWKELVAIGALLSGGIGGTAYVLRCPDPPAPPPAVSPASPPAASPPAASPAEYTGGYTDTYTEYDLQFAEPKSK